LILIQKKSSALSSYNILAALACFPELNHW
jgi:hypothetical protein